MFEFYHILTDYASMVTMSPPSLAYILLQMDYKTKGKTEIIDPLKQFYYEILVA